jgi:hypothetical protein
LKLPPVGDSGRDQQGLDSAIVGRVHDLVKAAARSILSRALSALRQSQLLARDESGQHDFPSPAVQFVHAFELRAAVDRLGVQMAIMVRFSVKRVKAPYRCQHQGLGRLSEEFAKGGVDLAAVSQEFRLGIVGCTALPGDHRLARRAMFYSAVRFGCALMIGGRQSVFLAGRQPRNVQLCKSPPVAAKQAAVVSADRQQDKRAVRLEIQERRYLEVPTDDPGFRHSLRQPQQLASLGAGKNCQSAAPILPKTRLRGRFHNRCNQISYSHRSQPAIRKHLFRMAQQVFQQNRILSADLLALDDGHVDRNAVLVLAAGQISKLLVDKRVSHDN